MTTFYRVDGGRVRFSEYWRMAPDPLSFLIAAGRKLFGVPIYFNFAIPRPDRLFVVEFEELPESARFAMKPSIRSAEDAGLELAFIHRLVVPERSRFGAAALLTDRSHTSALMIMYGEQQARTELHLSFGSRLADDTLAATTDMKKTMETIPGNSIERYPGANIRTLFRKHREHLERLDAEGRPAAKIARWEEFVLDCEVRYVDYHISRGVFVPMTEDELDEAAER